MRNILPFPIEKPKRKAQWGILAAALFVAPLHAQFVTTLISTNLLQPDSVAADAIGNLYMTDSANNRIVAYSPASGTTSILASGEFSQPLGMVAARGGLAVVDQNNQLIRFVTFGGTVTDLAGTKGSIGANNGAGAGATFSYPVGIAVDASSNLYVADWGNDLIREIDVNNVVSTVPTGGYQFNGPTAVAIDNNSNLWVADTGNQVICMVSGGVVTVMAGVSGEAGINDSLAATSAHFHTPSGLIWNTNDNTLLIGDSGNGSIRSLYLSNAVYAVKTVAGVTGHPGNVDGALGSSKFAYPIGICVDTVDEGFYVADFENNSIRVLQPTAPQPPVPTPQIGYVNFPATANPAYTSVFIPSTGATFNNLTNIVVAGESGSQTYISYGPTGTAIPQPGPGTQQPPTYPGDGSTAPNVANSALKFGAGTNDITVYAIGEANGRRPSAVASARFQFICANPIITGNNAAAILLSDGTLGSTLYYTTNNMSPTNDGSSGAGVPPGTTLSLFITGDITLQVRAFAAGLAASAIVSNQFSVSNLIGNQLNWGFSSGLGSTHFVTGLNMTFDAPITYTKLPGSLTVYTFQFDAGVTNNTPAPAPLLTAANFKCDLLQPDPVPPFFQPLLPGLFDPLLDVTNFGVLATQPQTLGIYWLVTPPVGQLYLDYQFEGLVEYSGIDETLFTLENTGTLIGELSFVVPPIATGTPYTLQLSFPSASSFNAPDTGGSPIGVLVQAPTNGPLTNTIPNALKLVTVLTNNSPASAHLVGDVYPLNWFNIGDFGDSVLLNDDVIQTMEYAFSHPFYYPTNNPYYNAMDSSDGTVNNYYTAADATIDLITNGDNIIDVDDVYVTLRRSLDPSLINYSRYWSGSNWVPTIYPSSVQQASAKTSAPPVKTALSGPRSITVAADTVQAAANLTAQIPIRVLAADPLPVRVFMFSVDLQPLDGSPPIATTATFSPVGSVGAPTYTLSSGVNNYGAAWLNSAVSGVSGANIIGTLTVTLPSTVTANSAYRVHFNHFSASPNGLASFHTAVQDGLITVGNRSGSSWKDGIPDTWRLVYFGTIADPLSAANADPDGDGASNWAEFVAGTNPMDAASVFKFLPASTPATSSFTLQWPSVVNKTYTVQSASSLSGPWTTTATNLTGNGQIVPWTDPSPASGSRYYRALVQ